MPYRTARMDIGQIASKRSLVNHNRAFARHSLSFPSINQLSHVRPSTAAYYCIASNNYLRDSEHKDIKETPRENTRRRIQWFLTFGGLIFDSQGRVLVCFG